MTLPEEVIEALRTVHRDLGWAIVQLVEPILQDGRRRTRAGTPRPAAELVHLPGRRALIVVDPRVFRDLRGVSTIPLADGRAFLALDHGAGVADLELAILDRLETSRGGTTGHAHLAELRHIVRAWRRDPGLAFRVKSIIVVDGGPRAGRRALAPIGTAKAERRRARGSAT